MTKKVLSTTLTHFSTTVHVLCRNHIFGLILMTKFSSYHTNIKFFKLKPIHFGKILFQNLKVLYLDLLKKDFTVLDSHSSKLNLVANHLWTV